jgi:hypothetical protein
MALTITAEPAEDIPVDEAQVQSLLHTLRGAREQQQPVTENLIFALAGKLFGPRCDQRLVPEVTRRWQLSPETLPAILQKALRKEFPVQVEPENGKKKEPIKTYSLYEAATAGILLDTTEHANGNGNGAPRHPVLSIAIEYADKLRSVLTEQSMDVAQHFIQKNGHSSTKVPLVWPPVFSLRRDIEPSSGRQSDIRTFPLDRESVLDQTVTRLQQSHPTWTNAPSSPEVTGQFVESALIELMLQDLRQYLWKRLGDLATEHPEYFARIDHKKNKATKGLAGEMAAEEDLMQSEGQISTVSHDRKCERVDVMWNEASHLVIGQLEETLRGSLDEGSAITRTPRIFSDFSALEILSIRQSLLFEVEMVIEDSLVNPIAKSEGKGGGKRRSGPQKRK